MAITTCLVHLFGRLGCFFAGCCYGSPTNSWLGVIFSDPLCAARPKGVPLHPTQIYEACYILLVMIILLSIRDRKKFNGQLFLLYLAFYAAGRTVIELFRGDEIRGYVLGFISHSQVIAVLILLGVLLVYRKWAFQNQVDAKPLKK